VPDPAEAEFQAELVAELREEIAGLQGELGRAEGRVETLLQQVSSLGETVAAERARGDRLEKALGEARRSVLERLVELLRGR
jgi:predicted  nucleic acid-binding Zn-ribbon protein